MLIDKQTYFENHYHQDTFYQENNLNHVFVIFSNLSCSPFKFSFFANFFIFSSKRMLLINSKTSDLLTNFLFLIFE